MATITVRGSVVRPETVSVRPGERMLWVGPPSAVVRITFGRRTPVEWQAREEDPGVPVRGTIKYNASGGYSYRVGNSRLLAGPELIVDGLARKTKRKRAATKRRTATRKKAAKKR
jgi:hypothetical protein